MIYPSDFLVVVRDDELLVSVDGQQYIKPMTPKNFLHLAIRMLEGASEQMRRQTIETEEKEGLERAFRESQANL
jgi:hypothetical protein